MAVTPTTAEQPALDWEPQTSSQLSAKTGACRLKALQKLPLADLRIASLVVVFLWIDWVAKRMKRFLWGD
jgi:hypothetical protein